MSQAPAPAGYAGLRPYGQSVNGRTLLANAQLQQILKGFEQLSHEDSSRGYHAKAIAKAVDGLRGCVSPVNSFMKNGNPSRRCIVFADFEIEYELNSYYGGPQTDVEIVDIRFTGQKAKNEARAAMWRVKFNTKRDDWEKAERPESLFKATSKLPGSKEKPIKVGLNGYADNLDHAAGMLPSHIARGEEVKIEELKESGYQLFYIPQVGSALKAGWSFLRDLGRPASPSDQQAARILAGHMKEAHDQGLHVEWTSHRGGSKVLTHAMKLLSQRKVNLGGKQKIFLSDHTSSHYEADIARRAVGMDTRDNNWHNATKGVAQMIGGQSLGADSLACSINELIHHTKPEERAGKAVTTGATVGGAIFGAFQAGKMTAKLVANFAMTPAYATMLLNAAGFVATAGVLAASVPSLNEAYNKGPMDPVANLANKAAKRLAIANK